MADDSPPPSPSRGLIALHAHSEHDWQPILQYSNQVVLYNPKSHALSISSSLPFYPKPCPYCKRTLPEGFDRVHPEPDDYDDIDPTYHTRKPDYFQLLAIANETSSDSSDAHEDVSHDRGQEGTRSAFPPKAMAEGYFKAFFQEEARLGMGANGSVYLCQHVLNGNSLGHFAVKKIAVGESPAYLLRILQEVRLLERLHHPNIITYHHAWLENCQFSSFGPPVPTLHVLMQWAEGGSLDDFIDIRLGRGSPHVHINLLGAFTSSPAHPTSTAAAQNPLSHPSLSSDLTSQNSDIHSRSARIRAFRAFQRAPPEERERMRRETLIANGKGAGRKAQSLTGVHLLSADEVKSLFSDVTEGLNFLHDHSILHLDLKPGNVLLTWDEGKLIPRAMLSDFGTSRDMIASNLARSGNTGTLEYSSPESLPSPQDGTLHRIDSKSDMWSLGMILHKLLFFKLPYRYAAVGDNGESLGRPRSIEEGEKLKRLEQEILDYPGFKSSADFVATFKTRRLPRTFLLLLEGLLNTMPDTRPSCEKVSAAIKEGKFDPINDLRRPRTSSLVPVHHSFLSSTDTRDEIPSAETESPSRARPASLEYNGAGDTSGTDLDMISNEKAQMLSLPSSVESFDSKEIAPSSPCMLGWKRRLLRAIVRHRVLLVKLVKSGILLGKAFSITSMCPHGFPRMWVLGPLLTAALVDAVLEMGFFVHVGFLMVHVVGVKMGCAYERCCL